jgi:hypothetical protein
VGSKLWPTSSHEHLLVSICPLSLVMGFGNFGTPQNFWEWSRSCEECSNLVKGFQGLFCSNYNCYQGNWTPCLKAWCGKCYVPHARDNFQVQLPQDEEGSVWMKQKNESRFKSRRNGDHLVMTFECNLCVFSKLKGRDPQGPHQTRMST